jgi:hypothetical protein
VIVWLNGTFGCGKTTTGAELRSLIPSSRLFDPEMVGYMLRPNPADQPVSDFQHWPPWRPMVVATATELACFTGQHLIAPQTILTRAYLVVRVVSVQAIGDEQKMGYACSPCVDAGVWSCKMDTGSQVGDWDVQEVR